MDSPLEQSTFWNSSFGQESALSQKLVEDQPQFEYAKRLCEKYLSVGEDELIQNKFAMLILDFFETRHLSKEFLESIIREEIQNTTFFTQILRQESICTKLLRRYFNREIGQRYLKRVLHSTIEKIYAAPTSLAIDSSVTPEQADRHLKFIFKLVEELLETLKQSFHFCPVSFREILAFFRREVSSRFPNEKQLLAETSGYFFLRFICPGLVQPTASRITTANPNPLQLRALILIGKILQNMANGVRFETGNKAVELDKFIEQHKDCLWSFLENLLDEKKIEAAKELIEANIADKRRDTVLQVQTGSDLELFIMEMEDVKAKELAANCEHVIQQNMDQWILDLENGFSEMNNLEWIYYKTWKGFSSYSWQENNLFYVKFEGKLQIGYQDLYEFLKVAESIRFLDKSVISVEVKKKMNPNNEVIYTVHSNPNFRGNNRDLVQFQHSKMDEVFKEAHIRRLGISMSCFPPEKKLTRINNFGWYYEIKEAEEGFSNLRIMFMGEFKLKKNKWMSFGIIQQLLKWVNGSAKTLKLIQEEKESSQ